MSPVVYYPSLLSIDDISRLGFITVKIFHIWRERGVYVWIMSIWDMKNVLLEMMFEHRAPLASLQMMQKWKEWLIHELGVLTFRGTSISRRNGQGGIPWISACPTSVEEESRVSLQAEDQLSGKQICREGAGGPGPNEAAIFLCSKEGQHHRGLH